MIKMESMSIDVTSQGCCGNSGCDFKGQLEGLYDDADVRYLDCITVNLLVWYQMVNMQTLSLEKPGIGPIGPSVPGARTIV